MPTPPSLRIGNAKVAPFKDSSKHPYGGFANTTNAYPVKQTLTVDGKSKTFNWPSSEHAFHAQKILHLKSILQAGDPRQPILTGVLNEIESTKKGPKDAFLPSDYTTIVSKLLTDKTRNQNQQFGLNKQTFDQLCEADYHPQKNTRAGIAPNGEPYTTQFMRTVLALKLQQHPALMETAVDCARNGIIPVETSQHDSSWASGANGAGANRLGLLILELGNARLKARGETPAISDPVAAYKRLQKDHTKALSHTNLVGQQFNEPRPDPKQPSQTTQASPPPRPKAKPAATSDSLESIYAKYPPTQDPIDHKELSTHLEAKQKIPTVIDSFLQNGRPEQKNSAAQVIAECSVKNVLQNSAATLAAITMVQNNRHQENPSKHDECAMKIRFNNAEEAAQFVKALYEKHGIHSHTLGNGYMKTPQGANKDVVYLTKDDLQKLSKQADISALTNAGEIAYETKKGQFMSSLHNTAAPEAAAPPHKAQPGN